ncbi:MAG TPA: hypothetical protein VFS20_14340 [Longimicrobium sp.]|nr:hypothetical protein [Longimicrobium sp.]
MSLAESPPTGLATYSFRRSAFDREREYVLFPDRIEVREGGFALFALPLGAIRKVRLRYDPSDTRAYYKCNISATVGSIFLRHNSYKSFGEFEDRGPTYATFVRTLLWRLAEYPGVRFRAGSIFNFILSILLIPVLLGVGWWAYTAGAIAGALIVLGVAALCCWLLPRYRPRSFDPLSPPGNVLPG